MSDPTTDRPNAKALILYLRYWWLYRWNALVGVTFSLIVAIQQTIVPLMIAIVLNHLVKQHIVDVRLLILTAAAQLILVGASYVLDAWGVGVLHHRVSDKLYQDSFDYLVNQDYRFFTDNFSGSVVTKASRFAKVYTIFNDVVLFEFLPQLFVVFIALVVMLHYSPLLGLIVFGFWLFSQVVIVIFAFNRLPIRRAAVAKESEQIGELADIMTNALAVKTFAGESAERQRYKVVNEFRGNLMFKAWRRAIRNGWIVETLCVIGQLIVIFVAVNEVKNGRLEIATLLLIQVYMIRIIDNIRRSSYMARQFEAVAGDAQEMAEMLEQDPLVQDLPGAPQLRVKRGALDIHDLLFQYDDAGNRQQELFRNFNLSVKPGERIGLVGPSGGGKTTITRLLLRFMDIQGGTITIDGQNIAEVTQESLRSHIAYVPQEPLLFHRSIKENVRYGKPNASDEQIIAVAKKSHAHEFIKDLPNGYETIVGERGVKLSGGQRQRVAIARAMLADAPILVLDEATSALDSESERVIQAALWELMKGKTAVVIAHRLSTIQRLDRIVVVDKGQIIESGTHTELLKHKGLYARLWKHQSGGFLEES